MAARVALVSTRPETVRDDLVRLLTLVDLAPVSGDLDLLAPPTPRGPTPAGGLAPWLLAGVAAARGHGADLSVCMPAGEDLPAWAQDLARSLSLAVGRWSHPRPGWCLGGVQLHRRLRLQGCLAVAAAHLAPGRNLVQLARQPEHLVRLFNELAPRRPEAAILDLTVCADGPEPLALHLLLAGRDLVAVETTACQLLGISPSSAPLLRAAAHAGWGGDAADGLEVVGDLDVRPVTRTRTGQSNPGGWLVDDGPAWCRRLADGWRAWTPAGRGPRRRFESIAWGRLWRDPGSLV